MATPTFEAHARALRRDPSAWHAVRALGDRIEHDDTVPALDVVVEALPRLLDAEIGCAYRFGIGPTGAWVDFLKTRGAPARLDDLVDRFAAGRTSSRLFPTYDALHPAPAQRNRAVVARRIVPKRVFDDSDFNVRVLRPLGLERHEHARVLVCDASLLLAWVGVMGTGTYGARELGALDALAAPLARRLRRDLRTRSDALGRAAFDVLIDGLDVPAFLVREDGSGAVVYANDLGRRLLDGRCVDVLARMAAARTGADPRAEVHRVTAPGLPAHALVILRGPADDFADRLARVAARYRLTPRQRDVLALLVRGEANKTIAERLRLALVTTEMHVSAILRKADVDSRAAMVARFWTTP